MTGPAPRESRIRGLDGLRAVAASMIFFYHAWGHAKFPHPAITLPALGEVQLDVVMVFLGQGVALFFVLSGFLLSIPFWQAMRDGSHVQLGPFFRRRFLRIFPAYLVVVILLAAFYDVAHPPWQRLIQVVTHLLLVHNWAEATIYNVSTPLWSVATEFQLYLLLPLVMLILRSQLRRGRRMATASTALVLVTGLASIAFWLLANAVLAHLNVDPRLIQPRGRVLVHSPVIGLAQFAAGIAFAGFYTRLRNRELDGHAVSRAWLEIAGYLSLPLTALATMALFGRLYPISPVGWPILPILFALSVLLVSISRARLGVASALELAPVRTLGTISYSFYLWHDFVLWAVFNSAFIARISSSSLVKSGLAFLVTCGVAWLSYRLLERRFARLVARLLDKGQAEITKRRRNGLAVSGISESTS